jgi:hypothetical protein
MIPECSKKHGSVFFCFCQFLWYSHQSGYYDQEEEEEEEAKYKLNMKANLQPPKKKKKKKRLTVIQRWLTQGENSDENMQPILWTERRTGVPASNWSEETTCFSERTHLLYLSVEWILIEYLLPTTFTYIHPSATCLKTPQNHRLNHKWMEFDQVLDIYGTRKRTDLD